jgi:hypothetical protein
MFKILHETICGSGSSCWKFVLIKQIMSEWEINLKEPLIFLDLILDLWCLIQGW